MKLPAQFPLQPRVEWTGPRRGVFREPFAFISPSLGRIVIPTGFDTDYASVPRILWTLYPPDGPWSPAAWVHDLLYWYHGFPLLGDDGFPIVDEKGEPLEIIEVTRAQADKVLSEGMKALGIWPLTRFNFHTAVSLAGGTPWRNAAKERQGVPVPSPFTPARQKAHFYKLRK